MPDEKCSAVKAYLQKIKLYDTLIENKLADKQRLFEMATNITPTYQEAVGSTSGRKDKVGDAGLKLADLEAEIDNEIDNLVGIKREIDSYIVLLDISDYVKLLHKRYFEFLTWEQIACDMHMSYRHAIRLHGYALKALKRILNEKGVL